MVADRVGIMKQGRLVAVREKEDFKHEDLEQIYMHEMQATESTWYGMLIFVIIMA